MTWRLNRPIWRLDNVSASLRLVLLALASFTDQRGANAYPSQGNLARMCCCNRSTVQRALAALIRRGLISPQGKGRKGTIRYSVNISMHQGGPHDAPATRRTVQHNPSKRKPSEYPSYSEGQCFDSDLPGTLPGTSNAGDSPGRFFGQWETVHERSVRLNRERMKRE